MVGLEMSRDARWIVVHCMIGWSHADVHLVDRDTGTTTPVITGVDALTSLKPTDGRLVGVTNLDAPNGRVIEAALESPASWRTLVPESDLVIDSYGVHEAGDRLLVHGTRSAVAVVRSYRRDGSDEQTIALPGPVALVRVRRRAR